MITYKSEWFASANLNATGAPGRGGGGYSRGGTPDISYMDMVGMSICYMGMVK